MSFAALLDKVCSVQRAAVQQTATGATLRVWAELTSTAPCSIQPGLSTHRRSSDGGLTEGEPAIGFFLADEDVASGDRIVLNGDTYEVGTAEVIRGHHLEAKMRKVTGT